MKKAKLTYNFLSAADFTFSMVAVLFTQVIMANNKLAMINVPYRLRR